MTTVADLPTYNVQVAWTISDPKDVSKMRVELADRQQFELDYANDIVGWVWAPIVREVVRIGTGAPAAFDYGFTQDTARRSDAGYRVVEIEAGSAQYQIDRYMSGMYGWEAV